MLGVHLYVTVRRDADGRMWPLRIWEQKPKMCGFGTSEMFICCWTYRTWWRFKLFPILTFFLLQILHIDILFLIKNDSVLKKMYSHVYECNTECFVSILQEGKVNHTESWIKQCRDLVKTDCSVKIESEYIENPRDKSKWPLWWIVSCWSYRPQFRFHCIMQFLLQILILT